MPLYTESTESLKRVLVAAGGSVNGKKKLQKLAYLCQAFGTDLGFDFTFHYYGVYSPTLSALLQDAEEAQQISVVESDSSPVRITLLEPTEDFPAQAASGLNLVAQLKDKSARVLEVLSTIVYLKERGYVGTDLQAKLQQLKGHLSIYYQEAFRLAEQHFGIAA